MKRYAIILSLFFISYGCSDDFTNINPKGVLSDATLANEQGVNLLLAGAYSVLDGVNGRSGGWEATGDNWWFDVLSDDAHKGSTNGDQANLYDMEVYNWETGNGYFLGKWNALFAGVNRANAVIALIGTITDADLTAQLAEATFLRGFFNMELIKIWENVPYISDENYSNQEFNQPNPGPIWAQVEADFAFAKANLPASQAEVGRINSWGATAFLGKAYLFQGKFAEARTELDAVISAGPYDLLAEYNDNFSAAGENGVESIFAINFLADNGLSFNGNQGGTLNYPGGGPLDTCCGFYQPSQDLANAFATDAGGLPLLDTFNQADITNDAGLNSADAFTPHTGNLDPRIDYTMGRRSIDYNGYGAHPGKDWIRASFNDLAGPYLPKKNFYQAGEDGQRGTGGWGEQRSGINYNIMRFADVLLMAAEAHANGGSLATATQYVNRVRTRALNSTTVKDVDGSGNDAANYVIGTYPADFSDTADAMKKIKFERRLELAMEGHRFFDLVRWGDAVTVINAYAVNEARIIPSFSPATFDANHTRLPIPINAIDLSGNILTQNEGF